MCAPKKLSARPISKQCGLARAHGARGGRKRAAACEQQRLLLRLRLYRVCVWQRVCVSVRQRDMCVRMCGPQVQKYAGDYPCLSLSPSPATVASSFPTSSLRHGCAALNPSHGACASRFPPQIHPRLPPLSWSHQLSSKEEFEWR